MYHFILFLSVYLSIYLTCLSLPFSSVRSFFPFAQCKAWSARSFEVNYYYSSSDFCPNFWNQEILPLPFVQRTNMHLVTYVNCRLNCYISKHGVSKGLIQFLDAVFKMWIVIGKCFFTLFAFQALWHWFAFKPFPCQVDYLPRFQDLRKRTLHFLVKLFFWFPNKWSRTI